MFCGIQLRNFFIVFPPVLMGQGRETIYSLFIYWLYCTIRGLFIFAPCGRERKRFLKSARGLLAPGLLAFFCHAAKEGKNALKPTV